VFCPITELSDPNLSEVLYSPKSYPDCFQRSVSITNIAPLGKGMFCGGPAYNSMSARSKGGIPVIRVSRERSLVKFREQLNEAAGSAVSFKAVLQGDRLTTVSPEWGILADPRRADALGFGMQESDEVKPIKWTEARPGEVALESADLADASGAAAMEITTLTGWERVPERLRMGLKLKVAKEVGGLTPANTPAAPFDPERDLPTAQ
jgi:hypothetical protein